LVEFLALTEGAREIDKAIERMKKFEANPKRHTFKPGQS
jgi:hypothetical protein